jgi:hypothetical protein
MALASQLSTRTTRTISFPMRWRERISSRKLARVLTRFAENMRSYTLKEKAKITAGAVTALVIVAWLAIIALALLSGG